MAWRLPSLSFPWRIRASAPRVPRRAGLAALLQDEHPALLPLLGTVRAFDPVLVGLGVLPPGESMASRLRWWPIISVFGLYSAGKSTFIDRFLGTARQSTGNQADDGLFTVICYDDNAATGARPGGALYRDPRFSFFCATDPGAADGGRWLDSCFQVKACSGPRLKGRLLIDSPGLDAGQGNRATVEIIESVVGLSDVVLVFFDGCRPEPNAMRETLAKRVGPAAHGAHADRLLYVLNHCDSTVRDNDLAAGVGAWRFGLAQAGLDVERFFLISDLDRLPETGDLAELYARLAAVDAEHGLRLTAELDALAVALESSVIPQLQAAITAWRRAVAVGDGGALAVLLLIAGAFIGLTGTPFRPGPLAVAFGAVATALTVWHLGWHARTRRAGAARLPRRFGPLALDLRAAFLENSLGLSPLFRATPSALAKARLAVPLLRQAVADHRQRALTPKPPPAAAAPPQPPPQPLRISLTPLLRAESLLARAGALLDPARRVARRAVFSGNSAAKPPSAARDPDDIDFFGP